MTKAESEPRTGVWIENGWVYRSDIGESRNPQVPKAGHRPEEVAEIVGKIQRIGRGEEEGDIYELLEKLNEISTVRSRFLKTEDKNP